MDTTGERIFVLYKEVSFIQLGFLFFLICHIIARREINNTLQLLLMQQENRQLTDTFNTRILLIVLLEYIDLLQFYKL